LFIHIAKTFVYLPYPENLYPIQMPIIPPIKLPNNEIMSSSIPNRAGRYPPAIEPTTIPSIISFFRDMIVAIH
jgi:hypothetical protein